MPTITVQTTISYRSDLGYDEKDICLALTKLISDELESGNAYDEIGAIDGFGEFTTVIGPDVEEENEAYEAARRTEGEHTCNDPECES